MQSGLGPPEGMIWHKSPGLAVLLCGAAAWLSPAGLGCACSCHHTPCSKACFLQNHLATPTEQPPMPQTAFAFDVNSSCDGRQAEWLHTMPLAAHRCWTFVECSCQLNSWHPPLSPSPSDQMSCQVCHHATAASQPTHLTLKCVTLASAAAK